MANGTLGPWTELAPMPVPRANHCSTVAGGRLLVIGGNHAVDGGFETLGDVLGAQLFDDGGLGDWGVLGAAPSPVSECTVASDGSTLTLVDGIYDDPSRAGTLYRATVGDGGALSAWQTLGNLPTGHDAIAGEAFLANGSLFTVESAVFGDGGGAEYVLSAPADAPDADAWAVSPFVAGFIGRPQWAFDGTNIYALGGYDATTTTLATGWGMRLSGGGFGTAFPVTSLPAPRNFGSAVALDGYLFVVGGRDGVFDGDGDVDVLSTAIGPDGKLGSWSSQSALPVGRTNQAIAVGGSFLYVTGGAVQGPGDARVFAARIRFDR